MGKVGFLAVVAALALTPALAGAGAERPPKLVEVQYDESDDGSSPSRSLNAFARRADAVRFKTRYAGDRARARTRYVRSTSNVNYSGDAEHPWRAVGRGGRRVRRLIHRALEGRGEAKLKVILRNEAGRVVEDLTIVRSECAMDPPFYPLSCSVKP